MYLSRNYITFEHLDAQFSLKFFGVNVGRFAGCLNIFDQTIFDFRARFTDVTKLCIEVNRSFF